MPFSLNPNVYDAGLGKSQFSCRGGHFCGEAALRKPEPGVYTSVPIVVSSLNQTLMVLHSCQFWLQLSHYCV